MKRISLLLLLTVPFFLQSCFDVIEEVSLKNDGSGRFKLVLNMSRSKTKINSILKMKKVNGHDIPTREEISRKVADMEKVIAKTSGISNVKTALDFDNFIATITCSFGNVVSLNSAVKNISAKESNTKPGIEKQYEYDAPSKTFRRLGKFSLKDEYEGLSSADREIFSGATYTGIFRFEDAAVATASNAESKIAANKKAVMLKQAALDIITSKKSIENKITLGK